MIAVIGAGTMGKGIAIEFARFNHQVILVSAERHLSSELLTQEVKRVADKYNYTNEDDILKNITATDQFTLIPQCNLVIEAISENLAKKRLLFSELSKYINSNALVATNTSSLSVKEIFSGLIELKRVIGLHFFNPVQVMKLVELSYTNETENTTVELAKSIIIGLEKEVVIVKDSPGFIVNRLLIPMINEASKIIDEGIASIEDVDRAMKFGANHPMGPLKLSDLIGNDITLAILNVLKEHHPNIDISKNLAEKVANKHLGRKSKIGFYDYEKGK